jgi:hypothetical protein
LCGAAGDTGAADCWSACDRQGNSAAYCANLCGTSPPDDGRGDDDWHHGHGPPSGQSWCWDACTMQGNSAAYCQNLCGAAGYPGTAASGSACDAQGNSAAYCQNLCGG